MNKREIIKGSFRILKRNKMRTFFMVLGIVIGIGSLSITFTIGKGFQRQITERVRKYMSPNSLVIRAEKLKLEGKPVESDLVSTLTLDDIKAIESEIPEVSITDPMSMLTKEVIAGNNSLKTIVKGNSVNAELVWNREVKTGEFFNEADELNASRVAILGPRAANILFGANNPVGSQIRIGNVLFTVKGVLQPKGVDPHGNDLDLDIIVPITTMMKRLMNVDYILLAKIVLKDENMMDEAVSGITAVLNERHHIADGDESDFAIMTPDFVKERIKEMTRVFNIFLPLISIVSLLAAGIVIIVLMLMAVNERKAEVGLRMAVGARSKDILNQFLVEVSVTSFLGGIIGVLIGLVFFTVFSSFMQIKFFIPWQLLVFGIVLPVAFGMLAGVIPARKAAQNNPVEALR